MPSIAILDDRKADRETIRRVVTSTLKKMGQEAQWTVVSDEPPSKERDVLQWMDEHDATVLLTDWKLNEGAKGKRVVNYEADSLIREIRAKRPSFPIFVITGFESEARTYLKEVENIFSRKDFTKSAAVIVPQMLRAGQRRDEEQRKLLSQMDTLARRVASGKASAKDRKKLGGLQGLFQVDLPAIIDLDGALAQLEGAQRKADALRKKVEAHVRQAKARK